MHQSHRPAVVSCTTGPRHKTFVLRSKGRNALRVRNLCPAGPKLPCHSSKCRRLLGGEGNEACSPGNTRESSIAIRRVLGSGQLRRRGLQGVKGPTPAAVSERHAGQARPGLRPYAPADPGYGPVLALSACRYTLSSGVSGRSAGRPFAAIGSASSRRGWGADTVPATGFVGAFCAPREIGGSGRAWQRPTSEEPPSC